MRISYARKERNVPNSGKKTSAQLREPRKRKVSTLSSFQTSAPRLPEPVVADSKISNYINNNNNSQQVAILSVCFPPQTFPSKAEPVVDNKPAGQVVPNKNLGGGSAAGPGLELKPGAKKTVIQASTSELLKCLGNFLYKRCYRCSYICLFRVFLYHTNDNAGCATSSLATASCGFALSIGRFSFRAGRLDFH